MPPARVLLVCVAAAVVQILLKTWALFLVPGPAGNCPVVTSPLDPGAFLSFFLSFLLRLVVGVPHHEKQKYEREEKVGDIDR